MDSTSTAGDFASEKVQTIPSAASLNLAEPRVQATELHSHPVQQGQNGEESQTCVSAKQYLAPDSPEATNAGAQAGIKEDGHSPTNDIEDDVSITGAEINITRDRQTYQFEHEDHSKLAEGYKRSGRKNARAAAIYTEGLEIRVGVLEKELLELQFEVGSKERRNEEEERQVIRNVSHLRVCLVLVLIPLSRSHYDTPTNSPCAKPLPLKIMQLSLKDWKNGTHYTKGKYSKASILLATTTETSSSQLEPIHPNTHNQGMNHQPSDLGVDYDKNGHVADVRRPGPPDVARLKMRSPWPLILIELLSGEHIHSIYSWIHPFKHFVVYEKQIRKFVELLKEINVHDVEAKDLSHTLNRIINEVVRILGPKRGDVEFSDSYVSSILQKWDDLKYHHLKVEKSSPEDQEEELEDDLEAEPGLSSIPPVDDPKPAVSEGYPRYMCTCLKDARDHLQLLVNTIDSQLGSLLTLHGAIRDRAIPKIRFEHLWHLFQPGDLVVTFKQPHQAYRVIHVSGGRPLLTNTDFAGGDNDAEARPTFRRQSQVSPFNIDCVRFDYDGERFGPVQDTISIFEYEEDRLITKLDVYPMSYAENAEGLAKTLLDRGRRFAEYHTFMHKRYEGLSLSEPQEEVSELCELLRLE